MKTGLGYFNLLVAILSLIATPVVLGQTTYTWTGVGDGVRFENSTNWSPNGFPIGCGPLRDTAQWDGLTPFSVVLTYNLPFPFGCEFGTAGIDIVLTTNQANSVQIVSLTPTTPPLSIFGITNNSTDAAFVLGGNNTANLLNVFARPPGAVHHWINDSTTACVINTGVRFQAPGGIPYTLVFAGMGDWNITNYLVNDNNTGILIQKDGPGALTWVPTGYLGNSQLTSPIAINAGKMILGASHPRLGNQTIQNNAVFEFNAPGHSQTLSSPIVGTGELRVSNGTLTLSGASTYTGKTVLGGKLIVNGLENPGISGPLGVGGTISFVGGTLGFSASNTFDYSSRFDTNAGQAYSIDTGGQNVSFATGLTSSGGTFVKSGAGTLALLGTNIYSGTTIISNGVLRGTCLFSGPVFLSPGSTLAPGASIGIMTINNNLTIGGNLAIEVDKSRALSNDFVNVTGVLGKTDAGVLLVSNLGPALMTGDKFTVFNKPLQNGSAITVAGAGANWINNLAVDGSISVDSIIPAPTLGYTNEGSSLQFSWNGSFKLQVQTNSLELGLSNNWTDYPNAGISPISVPFDAARGAVFFRLVTP